MLFNTDTITELATACHGESEFSYAQTTQYTLYVATIHPVFLKHSLGSCIIVEIGTSQGW